MVHSNTYITVRRDFRHRQLTRFNFFETAPQVRQVHKVGQNAPGFGRHLNGLFKQAITAGKRVRSETSISTGSVSVSSAAAELAQLKLPTRKFDDAKVCIIGAGKMSTLLVKHLASKGCKEVTILNRSMPRVEALAADFPEVKFNIHLMPDLMKCVEESDVIFAASGSEELLIQKEDVEKMSKRPDVVGGVRRFVDISVPRNIAPAINELQGDAIVYNVDDLKEVSSCVGERLGGVELGGVAAVWGSGWVGLS